MVIFYFGGGGDFEVAGGVAVDAVEGERVDGFGTGCEFDLFVDDFGALLGFSDVEGDDEVFGGVTVTVEAVVPSMPMPSR